MIFLILSFDTLLKFPLIYYCYCCYLILLLLLLLISLGHRPWPITSARCQTESYSSSNAIHSWWLSLFSASQPFSQPQNSKGIRWSDFYCTIFQWTAIVTLPGLQILGSFCDNNNFLPVCPSLWTVSPSYGVI